METATIKEDRRKEYATQDRGEFFLRTKNALDVLCRQTGRKKFSNEEIRNYLAEVDAYYVELEKRMKI